MTGSTKRTIAGKLHLAQVALANTRSQTEIETAVAGYGYTADKLQAGEDLYQAALAAVDVRNAAEAVSKAATTEATAVRKTAEETYQSLVGVARAAFHDNPAQLTALGIRGSMPKNIAAFVRAAHELFDNAAGVESIRSALAEYMYDEARLQAERAKIEAFDQAYQARLAADAEAQQATRDQEAALTALSNWLAAYLQVAKVALRGRRELLEAIGVTARSVKTPAQRAAPQKAAATRKAKQPPS